MGIPVSEMLSKLPGKPANKWQGKNLIQTLPDTIASALIQYPKVFFYPIRAVLSVIPFSKNESLNWQSYQNLTDRFVGKQWARPLK